MLHVHRSERADLLVDVLGEVLSQPPADAMAAEVVSVPTRGVERWITQRLSHRLGATPGGDDGVCANVTFPFPDRLVPEVAAAACGCPVPDDWWAPARTRWPLVELIDEHMDDVLLAPLVEHLKAASPQEIDGKVRRFGAARRMAHLYDRYGVYRPDMVNSWVSSATRGTGTDGADEAWQAHLWRLLRGLTDVPSPAERFAMAPALIARRPELVPLPDRVSLFGLTRLPASHLRVLLAVAEHRDVHLFLLHPSAPLWDKVSLALQASPLKSRRRQDDHTARAPGHPLLRSWGRDARELQLVLASEGATGPGREGRHQPVKGVPSSTLLGLVQSALRADVAPPGPPRSGAADLRPVLAEHDDSLVAHSCHGRARQVEVAREAVLHLMAKDPTLEPRHVVVMCPDIELFAPLVQAAFGPVRNPVDPSGAVPPDHVPELRARLADRSLRQTNPMLAVAARLLDMAGSRLSASQVLDFAAQPAVARRFGLDEDDLSMFQHWLAGTGVRWGADAHYRRPWKLSNLAEGTWQVGLDRLALGVAMAERSEGVYAGLLPYGDVGGTEVGLVGRICELQDRLCRALSTLEGPQSVAVWARSLVSASLELAEATAGQSWEADQLRHALESVAREACSTSSDQARGPQLSRAEALEFFSEALQGKPTRANFRTGDMTVCTLVPMRSVPHRVVCLVGLDDELFPRRSRIDGDDLLSACPEIGDRDAPGEDRQLLLDAVLAATEHLVITFEGRDQHLNQRRPPSVTVDELLDLVDQTVQLPGGGGPARSQVVVEHPLQPFDPANYRPGALGRPGPWRFDPVNLAGARAVSAPRGTPGPFLSEALPSQDGGVVQLASLVRFLEHPTKAFLRERLGFYRFENDDEVTDRMVMELGPLEKWALGDRLLGAYLRHGDMARALAAEQGRGLLPPGRLGEPMLREVVGVIQVLAEQLGVLPCALTPPQSVEVEVALKDGTLLTGRIPGVRDGVVLRCTYSKSRPKHRLRAWVQFLLLSAAFPATAAGAVTITQAENSRPSRPVARVSTLPAFDGSDRQKQLSALGLLEELVSLYRLGMSEPLPIYAATSAAWATARLEGMDARDAAQAAWSSDIEERPGESGEPEHVLVLGGRADFASLLEVRPRSTDPAGHGMAEGERSRFGRLALALWEPVLAHEKRA